MRIKNHFFFCFLVLFYFLVSCQKNPIIIDFSGKKTIRTGEKSYLSWETRHFDKVYLKNNLTNEVQEVNSKEQKFEILPTQNYTYTLIGEKNGQKIEKKFEGKIIKTLPLIIEFTGTKHIDKGEKKEVFLEWKTKNASNVYLKIDNFLVNVKQNDKYNIASLADTTRFFELLAVNNLYPLDTVRMVHILKVKNLGYKVAVKSVFDSPELISEENNTIIWNFPNAEYVKIGENGQKLYHSTDSCIVKPSKDSAQFSTELYVKYPNIEELKSIPVRYGVVPVKYRFVPSKLRPELYEKVFVKWETESAKNVEIFVDNKNISSEKKGKYELPISKNTPVEIIVTDKFGQKHKRSWLIRGEMKRPFIKNAIEYSIFKQDDVEKIKKRLIMEVFQVDRSEYPKKIKLKILVTDTLGNFIRGLAPPTISKQEAKKFFVELVERAGDKSNTITDFQINEINQLKNNPYDIGVCLDYSGSMSSNIEYLEKAIHHFINHKEPEDRMSIVRFDNNLKKDANMTFSGDDLLKNIKWQGMAGFGGGTALYAGADESLETFDTIPNQRQKIMFLFTDGNENSSFAHYKKRAYDVMQVARKARKRNIKIYPIALGEGVNEELLEDLGMKTDGKMVRVFSEKDIKDAYTELPRMMRNYYEITYTPSENTSEKGETNVLLKYNNNQKLTTSQYVYQTNENFDLKKHEIASDTMGIALKGKKIIVPTQAVAFFDFDKTNLKVTFMPNIDSMIDFLNKNPKAKATILGHTDLVGSPEKNLLLSEQRALTIKNYFISKGINTQRLHIMPMGKNKPVWKTENEAWQAQENRRIEMIIWE